MSDNLAQKNKRLIRRLVLVTLGMFGFGFALVPIYSVFCKVTGLNGKGGGLYTGPAPEVDKNRTVRVEFLTQNNANMPWDFYPLTHQVVVHPGIPTKVEFMARNPADHTIKAQAIPSISPANGAAYLHKTECFCFSQQTLKPGEEIRMPVVFILDTNLPKEIGTLTLSYTLFDITGPVAGAHASVSKPSSTVSGTTGDASGTAIDGAGSTIKTKS